MEIRRNNLSERIFSGKITEASNLLYSHHFLVTEISFILLTHQGINDKIIIFCRYRFLHFLLYWYYYDLASIIFEDFANSEYVNYKNPFTRLFSRCINFKLMIHKHRFFFHKHI